MSAEGTAEGVLNERYMLPRWRSPGESTEEAKALRPREQLPRRKGWIEQLLGSFRSNPNALTARDLLDTAEAVGYKLGDEIVEQARLAGAVPLKTTMDPSTGDLLDQIPADQARIASLRASLGRHPNQPLAWTELSRHYLAQGLTEKSERAMQCALKIAPANRYVLRSAARLFAHTGDPGHAVHALKKSGRSSRDPWLLSADIALHSVMERSSSGIKAAQRMLEAKETAPRHLAELAAAVGSLEHKNGRIKHAKRLFNQSLEDPNENSVAQALHVSQKDTAIRVPDALLQRPQTYEALARHAFANREYGRSLSQFMQWLIDEPFDVKPAVVGSCLSFDRELAPQAILIADKGLKCDPHNSSLFNNRAVAFAYCGDLDKSFDDIQTALRLDKNSPQLLATIGLLAYRSGADTLGLNLYGTAIAWLVQLKERTAATRAYLYLLRERVRIGATDGITELASVREAVSSWSKHERESEVPGLIDAVEATREGRWTDIEKSSPRSASHNYKDDDLKRLGDRMAIPEEALEVYSKISEGSVPNLEATDFHSR